MNNFSLKYKNIILNISCDEYIEKIIKNHFQNHLEFSIWHNNATYTLIIGDKLHNINGNYHKMVDKWFENATLDCYIDNENKTCYATNFQANTLKFKELLIQYFVANVFNRFLEINGYLGVHSSCVSNNDNGVLFIAGRNSGKTICMLNLMNAGFDSVTNDKIALINENDNLIGYGIAQEISIRLSPIFCAQKENQKYVDLAHERGIIIQNENMLDHNNIVLNDNELASLNGVNQVFDTPINCIIRPSYDPAITRPIFREMNYEEIYELMMNQYMSLVHDTTSFLRDINLGKRISQTNALEKVLKMPCYSCYQNEKTTEEFVDKIQKLILKK